MDKFFTQIMCDRCGDSLESGRIMSMFNMDCICIKCKEKERMRSDYEKALKADRDQIQRGNYNYKGIRGK